MPYDTFIQGDSGDNTINGTSGADNIYAREGDDTVYGGDGDDALRGQEGNDELYGGDGNDSLQGGVDADYMAGGLGNDVYYVDNINDVVSELAGQGTDVVVVSGLSNYRLSTNVEIGRLGSDFFATDPDGFQNLHGNELNNTLQGNAERNSMYGDIGNDTIQGYGGDDYIDGGAGDDSLVGGDGRDTVSFRIAANTNAATVDLAVTTRQNTGNGNDVVVGFENAEGTQLNDTLLGDSNANTLTGLGGDDFLRGRGGNDELIGGAGADTIRFEAAGAANGVDLIRNFNPGDDSFQFDDAEYDPTATLTYGSTAAGAGAQFVYDQATNALYYDADGAGGAAQVQIATILPDVTLTQADFTFV